MLIHALPGNPDQAISSGELTADKNLVGAARGAFGAFVQVCGQFQLGPLEFKDGKGNFEIQFSEKNYERNLDVTGELFKRWHTTLELLSRLLDQQGVQSEIRYVSTTDLTVWIASSLPVLVGVLEFYQQLLKAANDFLKFASAVKTLFELGKGPSLSEVEDKAADNVVEAFMKNLSTDAPPEVNTGLRVQAKLLMDDVKKGTRISIEYSKETLISLENSPDRESARKVAEMLENTSALEQQIENFTEEVQYLPRG